MKFLREFLCLSFLFLFSFPHAGFAADDAAKWRGKMQGFYKVLGDLLTDITSDKRFYDPANKYRIQNEANKLAAFAHDINMKNVAAVDQDPTVPLVAEMLGRQTKLAADEMKNGNRAYARSILRAVPGYCIACHTRNGSGPQFSKLSFEPKDAAFSPLERGEFFAASRQYDLALGEFKKVIEEPQALKRGSRDWQRAVEESLLIAVRVKQDAAKTAEIVNLILNTPNAPGFMKHDANTWAESVRNWQKEKVPTQISEDELYAMAVKLLSQAREIQKYPMDRNGDILYLRASATVHDLLQMAPSGPHAAEALFLAGLTYEVLNPLKTEDMHEVFYEACIHKAAHSALGEACYHKLEQSIVFGYTGSNGMDLSVATRNRLDELRALAEPVVEKQK